MELKKNTHALTAPRWYTHQLILKSTDHAMTQIDLMLASCVIKGFGQDRLYVIITVKNIQMMYSLVVFVTRPIQSKNLWQDTIENGIKKSRKIKEVLYRKRATLNSSPAVKSVQLVKVMRMKITAVRTATQTLHHISRAMCVARPSQHQKVLRIINGVTWVKNHMNVQNVVDVFSRHPSCSSINECTSLNFSVRHAAGVLSLSLHCVNISILMEKAVHTVVPSVTSVSQDPHS